MIKFLFLAAMVVGVSACSSQVMLPYVENYAGNDSSTIFVIDNARNYSLYTFLSNGKNGCFAKQNQRQLTKNAFSTGDSNSIYEYKIKSNQYYVYSYQSSVSGGMSYNYYSFIPDRNKTYFIFYDKIKEIPTTFSRNNLKLMKYDDVNNLPNRPEGWDIKNGICKNLLGIRDLEGLM